MLKTFPENKCRLCGNVKSKGVDLFGTAAKRSGLLSKISKRLCGEVHIVVGDELPKFICSGCENTINKFSEFCAMVQSIQKQLESEKLALVNGKSERADVKCDGESSVGFGFGGAGRCGTPTVIVGPGSQVECTLCNSFLDAAEHTTLHMVGHGIGTVICRCRSCGQQGELPHFVQTGDECSVVWCKSCSRHDDAAPARKLFACDLCSKSFRSSGHLERHRIVHSGAKPFLCEVCGCGFGQKCSLKLHVQSHSQLNPYKCSFCGQGFRFKVSMNSHILNVHGGSGTDKVTKHRCDKCGKRFITVYKLQRHYRCHTGDRPYGCSRCGKLFSQTGNLNVHRKKHEEEDANSSFQAPATGSFDTTLVPHSRDPFIPATDNNMDPKFLDAVLPRHLQDPGQYEASNFGATSSKFLVSTNDADKTKSTESELFPNFSEDGLLFIDEDEDAGAGQEAITLPTFSSLQTGALPHH